MPSDGWGAVDTYLEHAVLAPDPAFAAVLAATLAANAAAELPPIDVTANQGKLLHLIARLAGVRRVLEIGTLGGYSTIWLARALPDGGRLVSLEINEHHASVARANIDRAGFGDRVEIRLGPAAQSLATLESEKGGPFDLVFIDADKAGNPDYLAWSLRLTKPGAVIIVDNVVRQGRVLDGDSREPDVVGTRRVLEMIGAEPRLDATAVQTVGSKGWDGFVVALVVDAS